MKTITPADIVAALSHCEPTQLSHALASCSEPMFQHLANAVFEAAELKATYPRDDVIAEADALLYDVLRWPMADGVPVGMTLDPIDYARIQGVSVTEAERVLHFVTTTEHLACEQLLDSRANPNFTLEQSQVLDCIVDLRRQNRVPTRALVREHATRIAKNAMRPDEQSDPVIYSGDPTLAPRIASPSPKVHAITWLDRMDASPPPVGLLEERIAYIMEAKAVMGTASAQSARMHKGSFTTASPTTQAISGHQMVSARQGLRLAG